MESTYDFQARVPSALAELIPTYLNNRRREIQTLSEALMANDFDKLKYLGHRMRGAGKSYGFAAVSVIGDQIEHYAKTKDAASLRNLLPIYADYLARVQITYESR